MIRDFEQWRGPYITPFRDLVGLQRTIDRLYDNYSATNTGSELNAAFSPCCDITEDKLNYHFIFDLPGMVKDQIKIELHDNHLKVSGDRKELYTLTEEDHSCHVAEISYGAFMRSFTLPMSVDPERVEANLENGLLYVKLTKKESTRRSTVYIK